MSNPIQPRREIPPPSEETNNGVLRKVQTFFSNVTNYLFKTTESSSNLRDRPIEQEKSPLKKGFLEEIGEHFGIDNSPEKEREEILAIVDQWIVDGPPEQQHSREKAKKLVEAFLYEKIPPQAFVLGQPTSKMQRIADFLFPPGQVSKDQINFHGLGLSTIPDIFNYPIFVENLQILQLGSNNLTSLPDISNLSNLTVLHLCNNDLTSLPDLSNLTALGWLNLENNSTLTGLPQEILQLPYSCVVDITGCGLSSAVRTRLLEDAAHQRTRGLGPRISYSSESEEASQRFQKLETKSVHELLDAYYQIAGKPKVTVSKEFYTNASLQNFLAKISYMADFNADSDRQKEIATQVLSYVELASDPKSNFKDAFFAIIDQAGASCGDRCSLAVLRLDLAKQLVEVNPGDLKTLATLLIRGSWTLSLLEDVAKIKIKELPYFDEIGIYLAYPIYLKEDLQIPINVKEMRHFDCCGLGVIGATGKKEFPKKEKEAVLSFILGHITNKDALASFLISQDDTWIKALKQKYPEKLSRIMRIKEIALGTRNEKLYEAFQQILKKITLESLEESSFEFPTDFQKDPLEQSSK